MIDGTEKLQAIKYFGAQKAKNQCLNISEYSVFESVRKDDISTDRLIMNSILENRFGPQAKNFNESKWSL